MKILQCINSLSAGGAEVFSVSLAIALKEIGCHVKVFTYAGAIDSKGEELESMLIKAGVAHHTPNLQRNFLKPFAPFYLATEIDRFKPDICHSHLDQSSLLTLLSTKLSTHSPKLTRTIHSVYAFNKIPNLIHQWISNNYDASIACGQAVFEQHPYINKSDHTINNGIDLSIFNGQSDTATIRDQLGISKSDRLLINIGSFVTRNGQLPKAQDVIVRAIAARGKKDFFVVFLGEGEQRAAIEHLALSLNVASNCRFLGRVTNPVDYLSASDGVLIPSRFEGLSIGCIEAVCAGKPIIASDITAFAPFATPPTLLVPPESVNALASALDQLLGNIEHFNKLAEIKKLYYRSEFDIKTVATRHIDFYQKLFNNQRGRDSQNNHYLL